MSAIWKNSFKSFIEESSNLILSSLNDFSKDNLEPIVNELIKNNSEELLKKELILRKNNSLPPFSRLISIIVSANSHSVSIDGAREIKNHLKKINEIEVMGPVDSPLLRIKRKFRSRLLIRFNGKSFIQKKISKLLNTLKISKKIKLTVDVDPVNFT